MNDQNQFSITSCRCRENVAAQDWKMQPILCRHVEFINKVRHKASTIPTVHLCKWVHLGTTSGVVRCKRSASYRIPLWFSTFHCHRSLNIHTCQLQAFGQVITSLLQRQRKLWLVQTVGGIIPKWQQVSGWWNVKIMLYLSRLVLQYTTYIYIHKYPLYHIARYSSTSLYPDYIPSFEVKSS